MMDKNINLAKVERININGKVIRTKKIGICEWCYRPIPLNKLIKCTGKNCTSKICKSCAVFIDDKPFCHNCVIDIVTNRSILIVTKGVL